MAIEALRGKEKSDILSDEVLLILGAFGEKGYSEVPIEALPSLCLLLDVPGFQHGGAYASHQFPGETALFSGQLTGEDRHAIIHPGVIQKLEIDGFLSIIDRAVKLEDEDKGRIHIQRLQVQLPQRANQIANKVGKMIEANPENPFPHILRKAYQDYITRGYTEATPFR